MRNLALYAIAIWRWWPEILLWPWRARGPVDLSDCYATGAERSRHRREHQEARASHDPEEHRRGGASRAKREHRMQRASREY